MSEFKWFSAHRSNQVHFQSSKKSNKLAFKNDILEAAKKILSRLCEWKSLCLSVILSKLYLPTFYLFCYKLFCPIFLQKQIWQYYHLFHIYQIIIPILMGKYLIPRYEWNILMKFFICRAYIDQQFMLYLLSSINLIQLTVQQIFTSTATFKNRFILMGNHPPLLW